MESESLTPTLSCFFVLLFLGLLRVLQYSSGLLITHIDTRKTDMLPIITAAKSMCSTNEWSLNILYETLQRKTVFRPRGLSEFFVEKKKENNNWRLKNSR